MKSGKLSINSDLLKIIALLLMTLDHIAKIFPEVPFADVFNILGRFSFSLFAFILMYHLYSLQIYKKYLLRLGIWSAVTYLVMLPFYYYDANMSGVPFNILFLFFASVLALALEDFGKKKIKNKFFKRLFILSAYCFCLLLVCRISIFAFIYVVLIYHFFKKPTIFCVVMTLLFGFITNLGGFMGCVAMVATLIAMSIDYNAKQKRIIRGWYLFYLYYPLHLVLLLLLKMYI